MLRHWFPPEKINWSNFSANPSPHAIRLLSLPENYEKINWSKLSANPSAIDLLLKHPEKINWYKLALNTHPKAVQMLLQVFQEGDFEKIFWNNVCHNHCPDIFPLLEHIIQNVGLIEEYDKDLFHLSANPVATPLFLRPEHYGKICWTGMCLNPSQEAITLLSQPENYNKIQRHYLALNPSAIPLLKKELEKSPGKIEWDSLALNTNPKVIKMLEEHPHKINWYLLSSNKSIEAFELVKSKNKIDRDNWSILLDNPHALDFMYELTKGDTSRYLWAILSSNPDIFLEERPYKWELFEEALHPRRISAIYEKMGSLDGYI